ncbi:DUF3780 and DUF4357 domain-containing protein [Pseudidiomarina sp. 1ASP75-14]|uniref:anti-phage-associated DUF3780 domain-containing protein n=1 Tax=Pseudidiomarina terrestris TaxID=2820060 RepID=UPI00264BB1B3|nr:anti-phage-associated DUF3780 domain-containing protein [Pseudidiomarina sp. 1ASP75-14]MDN7138069.1 DUF3780 and DUF4357 domain-containing protein [Pseudidiomarina sp. 1ASP75-14]
MRSGNKASAGVTVRIGTLGFGVPTTSDPHHFKVVIPKANSGKVLISEHLGLQAQSDEVAVIERVLLERSRWTAIRAEVQRAFNTRLKGNGLPSSTWKVGENPVDRLLGKELCVLAWAIETMDVENIPVAIRNWLALRQEERWWLFGMTAKTSGGAEDRDVGWRIALRHALGDIVQTDQLESESSKLPSELEKLPKPHSNAEAQPVDEKQLPLSETSDEDSQRESHPDAPVLDESNNDQSQTEETLFLFEAKKAKAVGLPVGEMSNPEFLVKKGSTANIAQAKSLRPAIRELRQKLLEEGTLEKQGEVYSFIHEHLFKSPSAAACVIAGNPRSGMDAWRDMQGRSLKELGYGKKVNV